MNAWVNRACLVLSLVMGLSRGGLAQEDPAKEDGYASADADFDPGDVEAPPPEDAAPVETPRAEVPASTAMSDQSDEARRAALEQLVRRYEEELLDAREQVRFLAERKYRERRTKIENSYEKMLAPIMDAERGYRLDAIAAFEQFLARHPKHPKYTPDALFRLAELHFEKYDDEYQKALKQFRNAYAEWQDRGMEGTAPAEPEQRYERTIALYRRLISDFPEYRLADGAHYLLGYLLAEQGDRDQGLAIWRQLVGRFPESRFYAEVWFRIGDLHFEEEEWPEAIAAFLNVVPRKESSVYDDGLYKLAWTYYLTNEFETGVNRFFELLDHSYAKREAEGLDSGSAVEEEALQYVAISFAEDNWARPNRYKKLLAGDSLDDEFAEFDVDYVAFARDFFAAKGDKPYERDVMARLGDILFKQSKNQQSILALREALALDPWHRDAPQLQDLIIQAYERERQFDKASDERDLLVKNYSIGSEWAERQKSDNAAIRMAADLARVSLYKAAIYYHKQAGAYFDADKQDLALKFFEAASDAYLTYLKRYPHDKEGYNLTYYLAETYYYSLHFEEAAEIYKQVRDSKRGTEHRKDASLSLVYALEKVIDGAVKSGELAERDLFTAKAEAEAEDGGASDPNQSTAAKQLRDPEDIDPLRVQFIEAIDHFVEFDPQNEVAANFAYTAGAIYFAFGQFDEAIRRFERIVQDYAGQEAAKFAANYILNFLVAKQDWRAVAEYAARFKQEMGGTGSEDVFAKVEGGAKFQIAKKTLEDGQKALDEGRITEAMELFESGSNQYLALIQEDPRREFADAMMFNAALFLEKARRPARAAELYERLYQEYPSSAWAAKAMFNVAAKSEQAFNFDKAISTYLALVDKYPNAEERADAQINAALALEGQQSYARAAKEFERFATLFPDRPEAPEVFFRSAIVQKRQGAATAEIATLKRFIDRYQSNGAQVPRVVEAHARIGEIYRDLFSKAKKATDRKRYAQNADASFQDAVREFDRARNNQTAAYFAGKAAFLLAEREFDAYAKVAIVGNTGNKQVAELTAKSKRLTEVEQVYKGVITTYKQAEWTLASLYRLGSLYDDLQRKLFNAPCPNDIKRIDEFACDEYKIALEDKALAVEEKAVEAFRLAFDRAQELKLRNEWTQKTLEALNRLRPSDYPIDKEPISAPESGGSHSLGFVLPNGGAQRLQSLSGSAGDAEPGPEEADAPGTSEGASDIEPPPSADGASPSSPEDVSGVASPDTTGQDDAELPPGAADAQASAARPNADDTPTSPEQEEDK